MLQVENIEKYYGSKNNVTKALDRISFQVDDGEFIAIMGASGSGKTTLLNCISTIDTVSAGSILLDGENIAELPQRTGPLPAGAAGLRLSGLQPAGHPDPGGEHRPGPHHQPCGRPDRGAAGAADGAKAGHRRHPGEVPLSGLRRAKAADFAG